MVLSSVADRWSYFYSPGQSYLIVGFCELQCVSLKFKINSRNTGLINFRNVRSYFL